MACTLNLEVPKRKKIEKIKRNPDGVYMYLIILTSSFCIVHVCVYFVYYKHPPPQTVPRSAFLIISVTFELCETSAIGREVLISTHKNLQKCAWPRCRNY